MKLVYLIVLEYHTGEMFPHCLDFWYFSISSFLVIDDIFKQFMNIIAGPPMNSTQQPLGHSSNPY